MEKYVKPVMEVDETEENDVILTSCSQEVSGCGGILGLGGGGGGGGGSNPR